LDLPNKKEKEEPPRIYFKGKRNKGGLRKRKKTLPRRWEVNAEKEPHSNSGRRPPPVGRQEKRRQGRLM